MSFDGMIRPSQFTPVSGNNPYLADHAARSENVRKPRVIEALGDQKATEVHKELPHYNNDDEKKRKKHLTPEEYEEIMLFARMRGVMNLAFEDSELYQFQLNPETGKIDLIAMTTGEVKMSLTPDELSQLSEKIDRYAGVLTDRSG